MKLQDMKLQDMKLQDTKLQDIKMSDMKMQDMNMTNQKWRQGVKLLQKKSTILTEITLQWSVQILKPTTVKHCAHVIIYFLKTLPWAMMKYSDRR